MEQTARPNTQWKFRCRKRKGNFPDMKGIGASGYEYGLILVPVIESIFGKDVDQLVILFVAGIK